ncbi:cytochrome ubiquinol oxidase subunit I [Bordetella genomosp. 7]|uniref:Cytochrome ubiquinol oxidase subunit I n=1 Tax=Bordetella genomosp. 7 TaxID=1416805 RepID=A0A261QY48_9BORD|nr:cbb3-type cytochrome c oxidase subunit I [Bordetella genomosp. 7]OZI17718.1 cytochrome ubiquinol oxidase subunit I [Bordetella genomosp. 7]OZI22230.1 cytochrome ubiquinol oxidase subunit I [Bordetella genomosp. 7]
MTDTLPNPLPRPEGEREELERIWRRPTGWRAITVVNNNYVGLLYIGTALLFFLLAGILALLMRTQLAVPDNDLISHTLYNQLFTMHGTVMMFLFAVPAVEAMAVLLLPNMLGARDLPFPRLSSYAYWAYAIGGLVFFCSIFAGLAPDGGWFMYPPLTSSAYSPAVNADLWLLGIGFIEISAIAGAIELAVGILRTRAPGMTLDKLPIFAWIMLAFSGMVIIAFPAVIVATALLELERAFGLPFFIADKGGDPLLWQHLFWLFGHPEVYIIFLPAAGMVSMIVPAMTGRPLVGYRAVVMAVVATSFISFGLWVHHMYATGIPQLSLSFASAASMAVSIPTGIQIFAWIATIAAAPKVRPLKTPMLFILGFFFIFVLGGLTGVMVAVIPFDWQAHDTYFIVAHLHYVLVGGMVFPLFAAFYYWMPFVSRRPLSERLGRWAFWLMFVGFNVSFFPMHLTGLAGMPRRVYTYADSYGWGMLNMVSTIGAYVIAAGVLVFLIDLARNCRPSVASNAGNVWQAGTLEWLPGGSAGPRSVPIVQSREPLWDQPGLAADVDAGRYYLPGAPGGWRSTLVTSAIEARPQYVLRLPGPGWPPVLAALGTAGFFLLLTVKLMVPAALFGALALAMILRWLWDADPAPDQAAVDVGGGLRLPMSCTGSSSHSWWAMVMLIMVCASIFASLLFAYFFLWTVSPEAWPDAGPFGAWSRPLGSSALLIAGSACIWAGSRALRRGRQSWLRVGLPAGCALLAAVVAREMLAHWHMGLRPQDSAYAAAVYAIIGLQGVLTLAAASMALFTTARSWAGRLGPARRACYDNTSVLWHYTVVQGLIATWVLHGFAQWTG